MIEQFDERPQRRIRHAVVVRITDRGTELATGRLRRGRFAFWVPLVGLVVSIVATMVTTAVIFLTDPAFLAFLDARTQG